ncbi:Hypothetical_protein [Hexamita inflata]|uniref:Hypothetical_protein n=1 Tax=Hexamita inflata TaxID=28002 RepID=A0ABP1KGV0_9EUKA
MEIYILFIYPLTQLIINIINTIQQLSILAQFFADNILNEPASSSHRWKYSSNCVASWPSSFRFDFTYFPTGQVGLFQNIFNVLDFLQAFNFLQEYFALRSVDEFTFKERLQDQYQVGLNLIGVYYILFMSLLLLQMYLQLLIYKKSGIMII